MTTVGAYEAKTHLSELLDRVAKGESITITKHGVPVAVLTPVGRAKRMTPEEAAEGLRALRAKLAARGVRVTAEEIREWKHAGHKY